MTKYYETTKYIVALGLTLFFSVCTQAGSWYGDITYTGSDGDLPSSPVFDADNSDTGWQLSAGYKVNKHFALEVGYVDYGEQTIDFQQPDLAAFANAFNPFAVTGNPPPAIIGLSRSFTGFASLQKLTTETSGIRLATVGELPLNRLFDFNLHAGALVPRYKTTQTATVFDIQNGLPASLDTQSITEVSNEPELFFGLGMHWNMTPTVGVKFFWEKIIDLGDENSAQQDLDTYNLALRYNFN